MDPADTKRTPDSFAADADRTWTPLATEEQLETEILALKLIASAPFKAEKRHLLDRFRTDPTAETPAGRKLLKNAVNQMCFSAAMSAANIDPQRPGAIWIHSQARTWLGHTVPASCWGGGHPGDAVYRYVWIEPESEYEIVAHLKEPGPQEFTFFLYDTHMGDNTRQKSMMDDPISGLRDREVKFEGETSFKITVSKERKIGVLNHIQSNADARILLIRDILSDWARQHPLAISVRRVGGFAAASPKTFAEHSDRAAKLLHDIAEPYFRLKSLALATARPNTLSKPMMRGGKWGAVSHGNFLLANDEALLVKLNPLGAEYLSFMLLDPWLVALEHVKANGSLNNRQLEVDGDSNYTFVISARDPGIHNWLDTGGLQEGKMLIRWQAFPEKIDSPEGAVIEITLVKQAKLSQALGATAIKITPAARVKLCVRRALDYASRYATA